MITQFPADTMGPLVSHSRGRSYDSAASSSTSESSNQRTASFGGQGDPSVSFDSSFDCWFVEQIC